MSIDISKKINESERKRKNISLKPSFSRKFIDILKL